nr:ribosomal protein S4 [Ophioglossum vulgatum]UTD44906.1 ribosomal protein S4 [Ophioglossum vulgatum]
MLASGSKIRRQMKENVRHKRLNPRKRALTWGFPFRKRLRKKPFQRRKSESFSEKLQTTRKLSPFYGLPMKKKLRKVKPLLGTIKRNASFLPFSEKRLDVILVRISLRKHISEARQLVRHKHVYVNSEIVDAPGSIVSCGDLISIEEASKDLVKSNITECGKRKNEIRKSIKRLNKVKRKFLRPLFYPSIHRISITRSRDLFLEKFSTYIDGKGGKVGGSSGGEKKRRKNVLYYYLDFYYPHYLEVEYEKLNVVVFAEPPYKCIRYPYRSMERTHFV